MGEEIKTTLNNIVCDINLYVDNEDELLAILKSILLCIKQNFFQKNLNEEQFNLWCTTEIGIPREILEKAI